MHDSTPCSMVVTYGRFRDNRRGQLTVTPTATDMAEIRIEQPPVADNPATTTRIVLAGDHLRSTAAQLRAIAEQLEAALEVEDLVEVSA